MFISYDGLLEPVGASQILPYVLGLADAGVRVHVISFEHPDHLTSEAKIAETRAGLEARGIGWSFARRREPLRLRTTLIDLWVGITTALELARRRPPEIVHARGYVAGAIAWCVKLGFGARLVFDMRGFWPEQEVERGRFRSRGVSYRLSKRLERKLWEDSDHVVVLTERARVMLLEHGLAGTRPKVVSRPRPISVIPCCTDPGRFVASSPNRQLAARHGLEHSFVIGNVGATNPRYLTAEMFRFAFHLKALRASLRFVFLTSEDGDALRAAARSAGLVDDDLTVIEASPQEVPAWLTLFRLGVFFLRPSYAAKGTCYPKLAEFLAAGVPVVTNRGVGDIETIVTRDCGLLVQGLGDADLKAAARQSLRLWDGDEVSSAVRDGCRRAAATHLTLDLATERYRSIYEQLSPAEPPANDAFFPRPAPEVSGQSHARRSPIERF